MLDVEDKGTVGYYDDINNYDDWGSINAHDRAQDSKAFYSCWDKN
jgi:hypothetical protein